METRANVLYVDDEVDNLFAFKARFRHEFNIYTAQSAEEARVVLNTQLIYVLITDQCMPGTTGTELLARAVKNYPDLVRILVTAKEDTEVLTEAINSGYIFKYFKKPWNEGHLLKAMRDAAQLFELRTNEKALLRELQKTNAELRVLLKEKLNMLRENP